MEIDSFKNTLEETVTFSEDQMELIHEGNQSFDRGGSLHS
jgi:hypothetical protein